MEIQKVTCALMAHITNTTKKEGKGLAVPDRAGHFLLMFEGMAGGEYERVQIDDRAGDGYYIRLKDGRVEEVKATNYKRGGCQDASRVSAKCRLVVQSEKDSIAVLAHNFRGAIASFKAEQLAGGVFMVSASVRTVLYDFTTIFFEETTLSERESGSGWEGHMQLVAIDFEINFTLEGCGQPTQIC